MVDSINPKNENKHSDDTVEVPAQSVGEEPISELSGGNSFYHGFNRPDPIKVNLAGEHKEFEPGSQPNVSEKPMVPRPLEENVPLKVDDEKVPERKEKDNPPLPEAVEIKQADKPQEKPKEPEKPRVHMPVKAAKPKEKIKWRNIFIILGGGVAAAVMLGLIVYFGFGYYYGSKINDKEADLDSIQTEKNNLETPPAALELPKVETPASSAPTPAAPVAPPAQTEPIQEETPTIPPVQDNGGQAANG